MKFFKNHSILIIGIIGSLFFFSVLSLNIDYDASGIKGLLYWTSQLAGIIVIVPREILFTINDGELVPFHRTISVCIGLGACMLLDYIKNKLRNKKPKI